MESKISYRSHSLFQDVESQRYILTRWGRNRAGKFKNKPGLKGLRDYRDECKNSKDMNVEQGMSNIEVGAHFSLHHSLFGIRYSKKGNVAIPHIVA
jgi:hypothetical protein